MKTKKARKLKNTQSTAKKILISSLWGSGLGVLSLFVMLSVLSAICMLLPSPHSLVLPLCFFGIYGSSFLAGLFATKLNGSSDALLCGLICGAFFVVFIWIIFFSVNLLSGEEETANFIWKLLSIPMTLLGSFAGLSRKSKNARKRARKF